MHEEATSTPDPLDIGNDNLYRTNERISQISVILKSPFQYLSDEINLLAMLE